jgi:hypothetical protein
MEAGMVLEAPEQACAVGHWPRSHSTALRRAATKDVVNIVPSEDAEPSEMRDWQLVHGRRLQRRCWHHGVRSVVMSDGLLTARHAILVGVRTCANGAAVRAEGGAPPLTQEYPPQTEQDHSDDHQAQNGSIKRRIEGRSHSHCRGEISKRRTGSRRGCSGLPSPADAAKLGTSPRPSTSSPLHPPPAAL